jgi:hypothetical protein
MVNRQTGEMESLNDRVNDTRTNLIQLISRLYKKLSYGQNNVELRYEDKILVYRDRVLELKGCIDVIRADGPTCSNVSLGQKIKSHGHVPHSWLVGLL